MTAPAGEAMPREGRGRGRRRAGSSRPLRWEDATQRLTRGGWFWLVTVRSNGARRTPCRCSRSGRVGVVRVLEDTARKSRLDADGRCVVTTDTGDLHMIVEGMARRVRDETTLRRASGAFKASYDWPTVVAGDQLDAEYGARPRAAPRTTSTRSPPPRRSPSPPTARPPPSTRWRFASLDGGATMDRDAMPAVGSRPGSVEDYLFGDDVAVFKAGDGVRHLRLAGQPGSVSLKCDPTLAEALRERLRAVTPGYYLNKRHWNSRSSWTDPCLVTSWPSWSTTPGSWWWPSCPGATATG